MWYAGTLVRRQGGLHAISPCRGWLSGNSTRVLHGSSCPTVRFRNSQPCCSRQLRFPFHNGSFHEIAYQVSTDALHNTAADRMFHVEAKRNQTPRRPFLAASTLKQNSTLDTVYGACEASHTIQPSSIHSVGERNNSNSYILPKHAQLPGN